MSTNDLDAGRELMRSAWHELNAIRARQGAPEGVSHEWFDQLVTSLSECLGDETVPWMTAAAEALVRPYQARAAAAEAERDRLRDVLAEIAAVIARAEGR